MILSLLAVSLCICICISNTYALFNIAGDFDDEKIDYRNANQESKYRLLGASLTSKAPYLLASVAHSSVYGFLDFLFQRLHSLGFKF